ncbi:hypothetical protein CXP40_04935 [Pseudomonas sp. YY-1]|uniref:hypothetical protein n=1 Tax=unclassified Pseudomonas TaxID=196821 RepID=UPI000CBE81B1|nr:MULTISPECIES: hypothetical protein [unclassified Pseudomonas]PKQ42915.1 hypothetical protein CXP40_04935 [Pseudomonas sp. YY-1]RRV23856.1 hypothetical protein EGJ23_17645 [Pseudomonas sp. o96-267]
MPDALILPVLATLGCLLGCWLNCRIPSTLDQASLLPFADDPEAAARMTQATGRPCKVTTQPLEEEPGNPTEESLLA